MIVAPIDDGHVGGNTTEMDRCGQAILSGELPEYTCLLGTLVQETYDTHPDIRDACERGMSTHIAELARD